MINIWSLSLSLALTLALALAKVTISFTLTGAVHTEHDLSEHGKMGMSTHACMSRRRWIFRRRGGRLVWPLPRTGPLLCTSALHDGPRWRWGQRVGSVGGGGGLVWPLPRTGPLLGTSVRHDGPRRRWGQRVGSVCVCGGGRLGHALVHSSAPVYGMQPSSCPL